MVSYLIRRLLSAVTVLLVVSAISFAVIQLPPGDFTDIYKAQLITQGGLTETEAEAAAEEMRARYGLDVPVPVQYVNWIIGIVTRGEFGYSFRYKEDVGSLIAERLPRTIGLAAAAHATSTIVGLLVGIFVGQRQYSVSDNVAAVVAFILTSLPRFFWRWSSSTSWSSLSTSRVSPRSIRPNMWSRPGPWANSLICSDMSGRSSP